MAPAILEQLRALGADQHVMLKLTLPEVDVFYAALEASISSIFPASAT